MPHQDQGRSTGAPAIAAALDWLVAPKLFGRLSFRKNCSWTPQALVQAALVWAWGEETALTDRYVTARQTIARLADEQHESVSYQAFVKLLRRHSALLLFALVEALQRRMRETLARSYRVAGYLTFVAYGYRAAEGRALMIGWTVLAATAAAMVVAWITVVNFLYLLLQIAMAVEGVGLVQGARAAARFIRVELRELAGVFLVVVVLAVAATFASALAWSGVGLIAFVPLVGLAVFPLQLAALVVRGLVFEFLGLTALGAYLTLYQGYVARRSEALGRSTLASPVGHPA